MNTPARLALRTLLLGVAALAAVLAVATASFQASERQGIAELRRESAHQLDLFATAAEGVIRRLESVPATVQLNQDVLALLHEPGQPARVQAASTYLRRLNAHLGSMAMLVLSERGNVLAASDDALIGEDQSFRPYFLEALSGRVGQHFAIDARDGSAGYYVSHPIHDGPRVLGVAAVKISLEAINAAWPTLGTPALLADSNQVVVLSSEPSWRYTTLGELPLERRVVMQISRSYADQLLPRLPLQVDLRVDEDSQVIEGVLPNGLGPGRAAGPRIAGGGAASRGMLVLGRTLDGMDWRLLMFADLQPVRQQAWLHGLLAGLAMGMLMLLALIVLQRRRILKQKLQAQEWLRAANTELEDKVRARTRALSETNDRLLREVAERQQAETTLRRAQDELVHAGKMAALGQLATGITHELAQPLGAIRTLAGNALQFMQRGDLDVAQGNLQIMTRLADQMGAIIHPLKGYARKSAAQPSACDVGQALGNALFLHDQRLRREAITVHRQLPPGGISAWCDPNRLEQVLVNLIGNALDAMGGLEPARRQLWLHAGVAEGQAVIEVRDNGTGLGDEALARLFEPFFTTKDAGVGLGLGLAISRDIAREAGGELDAHNHPEGGACFRLRLPLPHADGSGARPAGEGAATAANVDNGHPAIPPNPHAVP
ncbi:ATP-binding protein [Ideonella sp. DXS22W]|uniref:histidine kinase n=1 Tax=Pseudaquabacterium inlustre TaxID=2984192 RepID=A0ABU9CKI9_9BURK